VESGTGRIAALQNRPELDQTRRATNSATSVLFGFVTQAGVKSLLQAYVLNAEGRGAVSTDSLTKARLIADTLGAVVKQIGCTVRFTDGGVEDHFSIRLADGATDKLRVSMVPDRGPDLTQLPFVPPEAYSVSIYSLHDSAAAWNDVNAVISSHADLVGAIAARPVLRSLLNAYGITDADAFTRGVGAHLQTVRTEEGSPAVLIADVFDRPSLEKAITERFGKDAKTERFLDADLLVSSVDNWTATFFQDKFLIGPGEEVRRCLRAGATAESIASTQPFRKSQRFVDVSLPLTALTFTSESRAAVSFVEAFSQQSRSTFSSNAVVIKQASNALPLAMSALLVKEGSFEWTSRSSFGIGGAIVTQLMPEK